MVLAAAAACCGPLGCAPSTDDVTLQGAGATFPAPLYKRWFLEYYRVHPEVRVNYQAIGSGAGIRQFTEGLVDFAASDAAMTDDEIRKVEAVREPKVGYGVQLLPMTAGGIAVAYNLPGGPSELRLSRKALVGIALGEITSWDDPAIAESNPGTHLPDTSITWIRRAEGSGTTFAFTNHLSAISPEWKKGPGVGKTVTWPVGIGAKGNNGVAAVVQQTPGAIGYVEAGYAELTGLPTAAVQNKAGAFVKPAVGSCQAALTGARIPEDLRIWILDPEGKDCYPIVTYTWLLCYKHYHNARVANTLKEVLRYGLADGQKCSADLGYVPLPSEVASKAGRALESIGTAADRAALLPPLTRKDHP
jgi:phosphate transport system substrate-binding protein